MIFVKVVAHMYCIGIKVQSFSHSHVVSLNCVICILLVKKMLEESVTLLK